MPTQFRSLRIRLLLPLLAVALLASIAVAVVSYLLGQKWAREELFARYQGIESTLSEAAFPLTRQVIGSLANLTDTELTALGPDGRVLASSFETEAVGSMADVIASTAPLEQVVTIRGRPYRYGVIERRRLSNDRSTQVIVFFDERKLRATRLRAASLPLMTGLSTVVLLTSVTLLGTNRLISRLSRLQQQVNKIAAGDFDTHVPVGTADEVGSLAASVQRMNDQLKRMWNTLQRQQGQKLLHQLAGGLAHQLRNSITGARMAVELHRRQCEQPDDSLEVAISQLEQTEAQMQRLLFVASGKQQANQPQSLDACLNEARRTLEATARHLRVALSWQIDNDVGNFQVEDGPSLNAGLTNLVLNALQAAEEVAVQVDCQGDRVVISVVDNGPGPPASVADEIFEPFVTSKPEGLGLGLPLVAESARRLGGEVSWARDNRHTRFTMSARIARITPTSMEEPSN